MAVARNARTAVRDDDAVAYIGELDEGSPHSIPFTNEGGVAQIGIADTAVGLTTDEAGANPAEPVVYRASGKRTFVRLVPRDTIQAAALVSIAIQSGCTSLAIANDGTRFGSGLEQGLESAAKAQELGVAVQVTLDAEQGQLPLGGEAGPPRRRGLLCVRGTSLEDRYARIRGLRRRARGRRALRSGPPQRRRVHRRRWRAVFPPRWPDGSS